MKQILTTLFLFSLLYATGQQSFLICTPTVFQVTYTLSDTSYEKEVDNLPELLTVGDSLYCTGYGIHETSYSFPLSLNIDANGVHKMVTIQKDSGFWFVNGFVALRGEDLLLIMNTPVTVTLRKE